MMKDVLDAIMGSFSQHRHCSSKFKTWYIYMEETLLLRGGVGLRFQPAKIEIFISRGFLKIVFSFRTKDSFPKLGFFKLVKV